MPRLCLLLPVSLVLACSSPTAVALGETVTLAPGQTARIVGYDVEVTFIAVPEDSRCPVNDLILCVWEGDARVALHLAGGAGPADLDVHTHGDFGSVAFYGEFRIALQDLTPIPTGAGPPTASSYRVTLLIGSNLD